MYRRIVSLCLLVALGALIACVSSDHDDDFDDEDSSITDVDETDADVGDVFEDLDSSTADDDADVDVDVDSGGDAQSADTDGGGSDEVEDEPRELDDAGVDESEVTNVAGVRVSFFDTFERETALIVDWELDDGTTPVDLVSVLPLAEGSQHFYTNPTTALPLGRYDVEAWAIDEQGEIIDDCSRAVAQAVGGTWVNELEFLLLIQCDDAVGIAQHVGDLERVLFVIDGFIAPDTELFPVPAINFAPRIETVAVNPSTILECPATVQLCATVVEPDRDPVAFDWLQIEGPKPLSGPMEIGFEEDAGVTEECVEYQLPDQDGHYVFALEVFDQLVEDGEPINIETWYQREGYGDIESHDRATVSFDVDCPKEKKSKDLPDKPKDKLDKPKDKDAPADEKEKDKDIIDEDILDGITDKHFDDQKRKIKSWLWRIEDDEQRDQLWSIVDGIADPDKLGVIVDAIANGETVQVVIDKINSLDSSD